MERINRLREKMESKNLDAFFVTDLKNIRYLSGFTGSAGSVLVTMKQAYFITDFRYTSQAAQQAEGFELRIHQKGIDQEVHQILQAEAVATVGIEAANMNVDQYLGVQELFTAQIKPTTAFIEELRQIKDQAEISLIHQACQMTDQAFEHILTFIKPGISEIEVANELERFLKAKGASAMSFDTIVASGVRSSMPHGVASEKIIESGDVVTLDFGCYYQGYSSDITRTIAVGSISDQMKEIYDIVLTAHQRVIDGTKPGMTGKEIDALARDYINEKGYGDYFGHSTGHGLGLAVHEMPSISWKNEQAVEVGMVITDEPGIYLPDIGGVRIEDDLLITENGVESLNVSPKELIII